MFDNNDRREVKKSERTQYDGPLWSVSAEIVAQRREYSFDPIGNRLSHTDGGGTAINYTPNELSQYDAIGPDTFVYDADGNLTDDGQSTYEWDGANRLVFVETSAGDTATFTYDYMGRRVKAVFDYQTSVVEERYVWDDWNLLLVLDGTNAPVQKFTWGLDIAEQASGLSRGARPGASAGGVGGLLPVEEVSGTNAGDYIYFYDANGNVGQVLDWSTGTIAAHYEYDPFGKITVSEGHYATDNRFRFSTKYQDQVTELYYYGYRYYSPSMGRWLNRDPINEPGFSIFRAPDNRPIEVIDRDDTGIDYLDLHFDRLWAHEFDDDFEHLDSSHIRNLSEELNMYCFVNNVSINLFDVLGLHTGCCEKKCDEISCPLLRKRRCTEICYTACLADQENGALAAMKVCCKGKLPKKPKK